MRKTLTKRPLSFSLDEDESGWIAYRASQIGYRRSPMLQEIIKRDAEREAGEEWRAIVRAFLLTNGVTEDSA